MAFSTKAVDNSVDQTVNGGARYGQSYAFVKLANFYTIAIMPINSISYKLQANYIGHNVTWVSFYFPRIS